MIIYRLNLYYKPKKCFIGLVGGIRIETAAPIGRGDMINLDMHRELETHVQVTGIVHHKDYTTLFCMPVELDTNEFVKLDLL